MMAEKQRYFMELAYCGTNYCGYQVQPDAPSVQEAIEKALSIKCREEIGIVGCGRTDTGVHASYYVAHFDSSLAELDHPDFTYKLNTFLPKDIAVYRISKVQADAHARFDATVRTYHYFISTRKNPFAQHSSWQFTRALDVDLMNQACQKLFNYIDFTSFSKLHTEVKTNNCKIYKAQWEQLGHELKFTVAANRFLRNMVRAMVGTLIEVGEGKLTLEGFCATIEAKNRARAGSSVPAQALFLADVSYPEKIFTRKA